MNICLACNLTSTKSLKPQANSLSRVVFRSPSPLRPFDVYNQGQLCMFRHSRALHVEVELTFSVSHLTMLPH